MKVFVDHNISPYIADAIDLLVPEEVFSKKKKFNNTRINDVDWINALKGEGDWGIIISGDRKILRSRSEKVAYRSCGITGVFLSRSVEQFPNVKKAARLLCLWEEIVSKAGHNKSGDSYEVPPKGNRLHKIRS